MQVRYDDGESRRHLMSRTKWREGEGDGEDSSASSDGDGEEFDGEELDGDGGGEDRLAAEEAQQQQQQTPRQRHAASARPPLPAGAAVSAPTSAGLVEWPEARVDLKLGEAAFARGWRVVEAWAGGAAKSHWRYISPDGTAFSSVKHVQEAQQEVQQEAQQEARGEERRQGWEQQHWERQYAQGHAHEQQLAREQLRQVVQRIQCTRRR